MTTKGKDSAKVATTDHITFSATLTGGSKANLDAKFKSVESSKITEKIYIEITNSVKLVYESQLSSLTANAKIPGFRPGKIPSKIAKEKFHTSALQRTMEFLLKEITAELLKKLEIEPAVQPNIEIQEFDENHLSYTLLVEKLPEIKLPDAKKIKIEKPIYDPNESDHTELLDKITKNNAELLPADEGRKSALGNIVVIDFTGSIDGVIFEGGSSKDHKLELGSKSFIDNFEEQLVGLKKGQEKVVKVTFPEKYQAENLAGKKAEFEVVIKEILVAKKPKLDEELAKKLGYADLKALKESVDEFLKKDFEKLADTKIRKELFDKLDKLCEFDIPPSIFKAEYESVLQKLKSSDAKKTQSTLEKEATEMATRRVKLGLLITEIAKKEKIQLTQNDLQLAFKKLVEDFPGNPNLVVEHYKNNPHLFEQLKGPILEDKVVQGILSQVEIIEKLYTKEKLEKAIDFD